MSLPTVTIVSVDDWQGVYVEGNLLYEDHSLDTGMILDKIFKALALEINFKTTELDNDLEEWGYRLPNKEKDLPL